MMDQRVRAGGGATGILLGSLLVACFCLMSSAGFAQEGPKPKVFLLPVDSVQGGVTPIVTDRVGESVRERLKADGRIELLGTYADILRKLEGGGQHASASIAEAERLYTSGIGLLTAGENQRAAETFQRAVDMMVQNIGDLHNFEVLSDAMVNLSLAYFLAGFDLDSRKYMQKFVQMKPDAKLDAEKFPAELITVANDERDKVKKAGPGKIVVKANIEGAMVFVNGALKGEVPMTIEDVGFGTHYLVVRNSKGAYAEEIRVRGRGKEQVVEASLNAEPAGGAAVAGADGLPSFYTDMRETIRDGEFGDDLQPYMRELVARTGAQYVTWMVAVRDGSAYVVAPFVYRAADDRFVQVESTRFNIELSNLRVGVNRLNDLIITAIEKMPEDQVFSSVNLVPVKAAPVATASVATTPVADGAVTVPAAGAVTGTVATTQPSVVPPPIIREQDESNTWKYVGWTGAAVLVGGAIAGGIYMLATMNDDPSGPVGFEAEVSW